MMNYFFEILFIFPRALSLYLILAGIFIAAFCFFKKIVSKYFQKSKAKILIAFASAILVISTFYIAYLFAFSSYGESILFEKSHWDVYHYDRFKMANDIIDTEMLLGKDSIQVKQILGIPNSSNPTIPAWYYHMGWSKGWLGFQSHELAVKFDNDKALKVVQFTIRD